MRITGCWSIAIFLTCLINLLLPNITVAAVTKDDLISKLQDGGLIVYIRHASTEKDYADQVTANVNNGSTQRVLSEKGWHEAIHIGHAFSFYKIPIEKVITSEYFRAWQTAWLAFKQYSKDPNLNFLPFEDYTPPQILKMKKTITPYLSRIPATGKNTIIVAHDDPFESATGIYPEPMGISYIIQPRGENRFEILGAIKATEW
jgi:phosphohistidine phosphatase SixA